MSEYVRLPPLPDSNDLLRCMTVIPYLQDMYHNPGSQDEINGQLSDEFNEHVIATIEGQSTRFDNFGYNCCCRSVGCIEYFPSEVYVKHAVDNCCSK